MFNFGDIVHVEHFPYSEKVGGKNRYAVVISDIQLPKRDYILAQITTKVHKDDLSIELNNTNIITPLKEPSLIRAQIIWTGNEKILSKFRLGQLSTKGQIALKELIKKLIPVCH